MTYVYRDQLLDAITPLFELLEVDPARVQSLRLHPHGLEVDLLPASLAGYDLTFKFVQIADRDQDHELTSGNRQVLGSSPAEGADDA